MDVDFRLKYVFTAGDKKVNIRIKAFQGATNNRAHEFYSCRLEREAAKNFKKNLRIHLTQR